MNFFGESPWIGRASHGCDLPFVGRTVRVRGDRCKHIRLTNCRLRRLKTKRLPLEEAVCQSEKEATVGLGPTVGVLQTPALPLGDVADSYAPFPGRWRERARGFGPPIFSLARRRSTTEPRPQGRFRGGAETQDRTGDTAIFSRVLYQLSYLGRNIEEKSVIHERAEFYLPGKQMSSKRQSCRNTIKRPATDARTNMSGCLSPIWDHLPESH